MPEVSEAPTCVADAVENLGIGAWHAKQCFVGGGVWLADGAELLLIGSVTLAVAKDWGLEPWQKGSVVSIVFVGVAIGNLMSGLVSDKYGRRLPVCCSYVCVALLSILSATTWGFWSLCAARFLVGCAFGFGQPAWNTLCSEISPSNWRMPLSVFCNIMFVIGELYSATVIWLSDPDMLWLDWRWLLIVGAYPGCILSVMGMFFLHESPSWLAVNGFHGLARDILEDMRRLNRRPNVSVDICPKITDGSKSAVASKKTGGTSAMIFSRVMLYSTLVIAYSCFGLNFVFYGGLYAIPQVLTNVHTAHSAAFALILGALMELPGLVAAVPLGIYMDRRPLLCLCGLLMSCSILAFTFGGMYQHGDYFWVYMFQAGYGAFKCSAALSFVVVYQYAAEIYPTNCRVAGTSVAFSAGRLGAIIAPVAFENLMWHFGSWSAFFFVMAAITASISVLVVFLPFETRGRPLKDSIDENQPADPFLPFLQQKTYGSAGSVDSK